VPAGFGFRVPAQQPDSAASSFVVVGDESAGGPDSTTAGALVRDGSHGWEQADDSNADLMVALRATRRRAAALKSARDKLLVQVQCLPLLVLQLQSVP